MIRKYRKKPVVIEAVEWTGNNLEEIIAFTGLHPSAEKWSWEKYEEIVKKEGLKIFTLEGTHFANIGDYIIKGVKGEFYPCKPDIFEATYESIEEEKDV
jgi:ADP-heptose:LPS heptosyltransferase